MPSDRIWNVWWRCPTFCGIEGQIRIFARNLLKILGKVSFWRIIGDLPLEPMEIFLEPMLTFMGNYRSARFILLDACKRQDDGNRLSDEKFPGRWMYKDSSLIFIYIRQFWMFGGRGLPSKRDGKVRLRVFPTTLWLYGNRLVRMSVQ